MNTNNLYEKVNQTENQINYEELYSKNGKNDKKNNPEHIFNVRFNEGINILRQPLQAQPSVLDNNQIFNNDNNYDATKNFYNRYQNNFINQSLMNCEEGSGIGNFAVFKSDPNSNNYINSLTNQLTQNQQPQQQQQQPKQMQQQQQQQPQQQQQQPKQMQQQQQQQPKQMQQQQQRPKQMQQQQQQLIQNQQQLMQNQQKCDYCVRQMQNIR
jgi:hypothetical protein